MTLFSRLLCTTISIALLGASVMLLGVPVWRTATGCWVGEKGARRKAAPVRAEPI